MADERHLQEVAAMATIAMTMAERTRISNRCGGHKRNPGL
jgi:hypothetical protein